MYKLIAASIIVLLPTVTMANSIETTGGLNIITNFSDNELAFKRLTVNTHRLTKRKHRVLSEQRQRNAELNSTMQVDGDPLSAAAHLIIGN